MGRISSSFFVSGMSLSSFGRLAQAASLYSGRARLNRCAGQRAALGEKRNRAKVDGEWLGMEHVCASTRGALTDRFGYLTNRAAGSNSDPRFGRASRARQVPRAW